MKKPINEEIKRMQTIAGIIKEEAMEGARKQSFTVIDSYSSRNDNDEYDYGYVKGGDPRSALINYLTSKRRMDPQEAEEWVTEIETRFDHNKRRQMEVWASDDEFYAVIPGEIDTDRMEQILKRL